MTAADFYWVPESRWVEGLPEKPKRVWTVIQRDKPELPFYPAHGWTAYIEDAGHDWAWRGGKLKYFSRYAESGVWIYCEF